MLAHGGRLMLAPTAFARTPAVELEALMARDAAPPQLDGAFGHLFGAPSPEQRYRIGGADPHASDAGSARCRELMSRLAGRMAEPWPWEQQAELQPWENPELPSGYTYLLQLVAHDLVQTTVPLSLLEELVTGARNVRGASLCLDTLYGGGPLTCPVAFAPDDPRDLTRTKLRLGRIRGGTLPFRDLARVGVAGGSGAPRAGLTDALIADPRNDANAILAQLTTLFHMFHNAICDLLPPLADAAAAAGSLVEGSVRRYLCARAAVTAVYRRLIRDDLLRRILDEDVYAHYAAGNRLSRGDEVGPGRGIPVEFTHGAFRFGHAMVRNRYRFGQGAEFDLAATQKRNSAWEPGNMPLDHAWIVRWSEFFEINGSRPNLSRRIAPEYSAGFLDDELFGAIDGTGRIGLAYRDLMSASYLGLWSVGALATLVAERAPALAARSPMLSAPAAREAAIREWLTEAAVPGTFSNADLDDLSRDPPLPFYCLFEAATEARPKGVRLGVLGSVIVAEVVYGALDTATGPAGANLPAELDEIGRTFFGRPCLDRLGAIETMAQLVEMVADLDGLRQADPAFI